MRPRIVGGFVERAGERPVQDVVDERRFARSADTGHGREHAQRDPHIEILQVVLSRPANHEVALQLQPAAFRSRNRTRARQIGPCERRRRLLHQLRGGALKYDLSAVLARARAKIDDVIGRPYRFLVVLDDDDRVAQIAQTGERPE